MFRREQRVGRDPVEVSALPSSARPFLHTPGSVRITVSVPLPLGVRVFDVLLPIAEIDNLTGSLGFGGGGLRELPLIEKIHFNDDVLQVVEFRSRNPIEVVVPEQVILVAQGGEIMSPGVAMALRIQN